jgi:hypothetical protein
MVLNFIYYVNKCIYAINASVESILTNMENKFPFFEIRLY